jgi:DNA-binding XRE family transcriptional regulator
MEQPRNLAGGDRIVHPFLQDEVGRFQLAADCKLPQLFVAKGTILLSVPQHEPLMRHWEISEHVEFRRSVSTGVLPSQVDITGYFGRMVDFSQQTASGRMANFEAMLGIELRKAREDAGLSQEKLAFAAEIDRSYVSMLENDKKSPTLDVLFRICDSLKIPASELIARVEKTRGTRTAGRTAKQRR